MVGAIETELEMILQTGMVEEMVVTETVEEIVRETVGIGAMVVVKVVGTIETEMEMIVKEKRWMSIRWILSPKVYRMVMRKVKGRNLKEKDLEEEIMNEIICRIRKIHVFEGN